MELIATILTYVAYVVAGSSVALKGISKMTKNTTDDKIAEMLGNFDVLGLLKKLLEFLSLNEKPNKGVGTSPGEE